MPRATNAPASRRRRQRVIKASKGYRGNRSKLFRYAKNAQYKAKHWATRGRHEKKREFRALWNARINIASRNLGLTYSRLIQGLKKAGVGLNRKVLAELAVNDEPAFAALVEKAKSSLPKN
jgi:large subunit ribosomal protein L20